MGYYKDQMMEEQQEAEAKFASLAQMKGWACTICNKLIDEGDYDAYKISGYLYCGGCNNTASKMMAE